MNVAINSTIYQQASDFARSRGMNLNELIESFLVRLVVNGRQEATEQPIPDVVLSLLGAGEPIGKDDLNAREAYHRYLEGKYE